MQVGFFEVVTMNFSKFQICLGFKTWILIVKMFLLFCTIINTKCGESEWFKVRLEWKMKIRMLRVLERGGVLEF